MSISRLSPAAVGKQSLRWRNPHLQTVSALAEPASAKRFCCTVNSGKPGQNHTINVKAERIQ
jgi:hypothetical protein